MRSYNDRSKFLFLQTLQSHHNTSYLRTSHFCKRCQYCFLALIFLYTLKNVPWKNYVRFLKWNLKHTLQSAQNSFSSKSKFQVLHYIQHDFICQCPGLSKDQISMYGKSSSKRPPSFKRLPPINASSKIRKIL